MLCCAQNFLGALGLLCAPLRGRKLQKITENRRKNPENRPPAEGGAGGAGEIFRFCNCLISKTTQQILLKFVWELPRNEYYFQKNFGGDS